MILTDEIIRADLEKLIFPYVLIGGMFAVISVILLIALIILKIKNKRIEKNSEDISIKGMKVNKDEISGAICFALTLIMIICFVLTGLMAGITIFNYIKADEYMVTENVVSTIKTESDDSLSVTLLDSRKTMAVYSDDVFSAGDRVYEVDNFAGNAVLIYNCNVYTQYNGTHWSER